jgi:hypothetical protein
MVKPHSSNPRASRERRARHATWRRVEEREGGRGLYELGGRGHRHDHSFGCLVRWAHAMHAMRSCSDRPNGLEGPHCTRRLGHPGVLHTERAYRSAELVARWTA